MQATTKKHVGKVTRYGFTTRVVLWDNSISVSGRGKNVDTMVLVGRGLSEDGRRHFAEVAEQFIGNDCMLAYVDALGKLREAGETPRRGTGYALGK